MKISIGYFVLSILTLPFVGRWWLGELPVLALIQLPKTFLADSLRTGVVMKIIKVCGWSKGSFSPDYGMARPYGLALAYLILLTMLTFFVWRRVRNSQRSRLLGLMLLIIAVMDYFFTLLLLDQRGLTMY